MAIPLIILILVIFCEMGMCWQAGGSLSEVIWERALHRAEAAPHEEGLASIQGSRFHDFPERFFLPRGAQCSEGPPAPVTLATMLSSARQMRRHNSYPHSPEGAGAGSSPGCRCPACNGGPLAGGTGRAAWPGCRQGIQRGLGLPMPVPVHVEARRPWGRYFILWASVSSSVKWGWFIVPRLCEDWVLGRAWRVISTR